MRRLPPFVCCLAVWSVACGSVSPASAPLVTGDSGVLEADAGEADDAGLDDGDPATQHDPRLAGLQISLGALVPAFSPDVQSYKVAQVNSLTPITVTAFSQAVNATLQVNGIAAVSGHPTRLQLEANGGLSIDVRTPSGTTASYQVTFVAEGAPAFTTWSSEGAGSEVVLLTPGCLLAVDRSGAVRFFRPTPREQVFDFKQLPGVGYSYSSVPIAGLGLPATHVVDQNFEELATAAPLTHSGYEGAFGDPHDFVWLGDHHWLVMSYFQKPVDVSSLDFTWSNRAPVVAAVVQEIDHGRLVFEWDSTHHRQLFFDSIDGNGFQAEPASDYVHINSIEVDPVDQNLILSLRHTNSVIKVSRTTGDILWSLGGRSDDFGITAEQLFSHQHFARLEPDHSLVLFDNGNNLHPSRALRFTLDEVNRHIEKFEVIYERPADFPLTAFMGSVSTFEGQRALIGWGGWAPPAVAPPSVTEVVGGVPVWSLTFALPNLFSYRAMPAVR